MDKTVRNWNTTIVLSVKWTIFEIIAVDIAIIFVVVMFFYVFYQNIVKTAGITTHVCFSFVIFAFFCFLELSADILLLFHLVISSVDSVRWS